MKWFRPLERIFGRSINAVTFDSMFVLFAPKKKICQKSKTQLADLNCKDIVHDPSHCSQETVFYGWLSKREDNAWHGIKEIV